MINGNDKFSEAHEYHGNGNDRNRNLRRLRFFAEKVPIEDDVKANENREIISMLKQRQFPHQRIS